MIKIAWEIALALSFIGTAFIMIYLASTFSEEHSILKLLFIFVGLFISAVAISSNYQIVQANNNTINSSITSTLNTQIGSAYKGVIYSSIVAVGYIFVYLLWLTVSTIMKKRKGKNGATA